MNNNVLVVRFIEQLRRRGLHVFHQDGDPPDQLRIGGPKEEKTQEIIDALKAFKPQLLEIYGPRKREAAPPQETAVENDPEPER